MPRPFTREHLEVVFSTTVQITPQSGSIAAKDLGRDLDEAIKDLLARKLDVCNDVLSMKDLFQVMMHASVALDSLSLALIGLVGVNTGSAEEMLIATINKRRAEEAGLMRAIKSGFEDHEETHNVAFEFGGN